MSWFSASTLRRELTCYTQQPLRVVYEWRTTYVYLLVATRGTQNSVKYGPVWHRTALKLDELYSYKKLVIRQRSPKHA